MSNEHLRPLAPLSGHGWKDNASGRFVVSIDSIKPTFAKIDLSGDLVIRRSSKSEGVLFGRLSPFSMPQPAQVVATTTVPAMKYFEAEMLARERFELVLTALRLVGVSHARIGDGFAVQDDDLHSAKPVRFWLKRFELPELWRLVPYKLDRSEAHRLREAYGRLPHISHGPARVAIARFDSAHNRQTQEDRFIDVWIGLEALFSPTDKMEVRYRIALRGAHFIGTSQDDRSAIYKVLLASYDLRSEVIHGKKLTVRQAKGLNLPGREVVALTEGYLRRALERIILSDEQFQPELIDGQIATGGSEFWWLPAG